MIDKNEEITKDIELDVVDNFLNEIINHKWCFDDMALRAFHIQMKYNPLYSSFAQSLMKKYESPIDNLDDIVFLPISLYKQHLIKTGEWQPEIEFYSSGTTGANTSKHAIKSVEIYLRNSKQIFESFYGPLEDYTILALLPSYFEQKHSSLLHMVGSFIERTKENGSRFILGDHHLLNRIVENHHGSNKVLIWGVSYALLDLIGHCTFRDDQVIILETGGMKGRRREMTKNELHSTLTQGLGVSNIHSEYGMTELSSQAYSLGNGLFRPGKTMCVYISDPNDPLTIKKNGKGVLNIIDLTNIHSCCFIQTEDVGEVFSDGSFRIYGRLDTSQLRGCNMLYPS